MQSQLQTGQIIVADAVSDRSLRVEFYYLPCQNHNASIEQGRAIYEDKLYINIANPGDKTTDLHRPATEEDKLRFPRHWAHFEKTGGQGVVGTPLKEWPQATASQIKEWQAQGVFTVEQLANMSDTNVGVFIGGMGLRAKARLFLEAAAEAAPGIKLAEELKLRDEKIAELTRRIEEMATPLAPDTVLKTDRAPRARA
jgi:hypothetical protein